MNGGVTMAEYKHSVLRCHADQCYVPTTPTCAWSCGIDTPERGWRAD